MSRSYNPAAWFWSVGGQSPEIYDSEQGIYVDPTDQRVLDFLADTHITGEPLQVTNILDSNELQEVLTRAGVPYLGSLGALEEDQPRVSRARCRVTCTGQTIQNATPTALIFDTEQKDPLGFHSVVTNPERLVISQAGLYLVIGHIAVLESTAGAGGTPNSGRRAAQLRKNLGGGASDEGTTSIGASPSDDTEFPVFGYIQFSAGDILRILCEQDCGGTIDVQARLSLMRVE